MVTMIRLARDLRPRPPSVCGLQVTVEVQKKDGGYVVLTFILVGSIAGVVLAVTIIYLLKRHRRSREKLAQLASTGDGNEASKDYQVGVCPPPSLSPSLCLPVCGVVGVRSDRHTDGQTHTHRQRERENVCLSVSVCLSV